MGINNNNCIFFKMAVKMAADILNLMYNGSSTRWMSREVKQRHWVDEDFTIIIIRLGFSKIVTKAASGSRT